MTHLFTSESVSPGHPDKVADQISDAILDQFMARDPESHVACETLVTTGQVVVAGEVCSDAYVNVPDTVRRTIAEIGYDRPGMGFEASSCGVLSAIHEQSQDINRGVDHRRKGADQGAGDQGMMFGYATDETPERLPLTLSLSNALMRILTEIRREGREMKYLRPDAKSQVTVEYDEQERPVRIHTIVLSTQHDEFVKPGPGISQAEADRQMQRRIQEDVRQIVLPRLKAQLDDDTRRLFDRDLKLWVNPTGRFVTGGPDGDTGLTGRKIIVDTYGGRGAHGGGAFSGKDPSKVDRSAAYAARQIARTLVDAGIARRALVQVAYAIGVAQPVSLTVNTFGTGLTGHSDEEIAAMVQEVFDMRPAAIEERLGLRKPIYYETAALGHMGRKPEKKVKHFRRDDGTAFDVEVELFTWEKPTYVEAMRQALHE